MKATIHFTEKEVIITSSEKINHNDLFFNSTSQRVYKNDMGYDLSENYPNEAKITAELPLTPDLEKLLLKAVIEKEAADMYPERIIPDLPKGSTYEAATEYNQLLMQTNGYNKSQQRWRKEYISWWNTILERLPSEEELRGVFSCTEHWEGSDYIISKLLPPLPSSAHCECEEVNGKITVKKIWI